MGAWLAVVGARPNFVKLAPLIRAARAARQRLAWVHTGQHRATAMSAAMIRDLGLPAPVASLRTGAPGPRRLANLTRRVEGVLVERRPDAVIVVGDVDSSRAAARAASALRIPLAHVEAGLRSFDARMPEERNRIAIDARSDFLYVSERVGRENLAAEGIRGRRVAVCGNVMADALRSVRDRLAPQRTGGAYVVATLHRQANVDDVRMLERWLDALRRVARDIPVVLPMHPRTRRRLADAGVSVDGIEVVAPLPYLAFLGLVAHADAVLTDSGGLQVEAALLRVPCLTLRRSTEHQLTLEVGANRLVSDPRRLPRALDAALGAGPWRGRRPRVWDGRAAERIVAHLRAGLRAR